MKPTVQIVPAVLLIVILLVGKGHCFAWQATRLLLVSDMYMIIFEHIVQLWPSFHCMSAVLHLKNHLSSQHSETSFQL